MKLIILFSLFLINCGKVPLDLDYGSISFANIHWFENEKTAYIFFSLAEKKARLIDPRWDLSYSHETLDGGIQLTEISNIDFSQGVHLHRLVDCGEYKICGSYSFSLDYPLNRATLRFRYDNASGFAIEKEMIVSNHRSTELFSSFSALAYGSFDEINEHIRIQVVDNFGDLSTSEISRYGMERNFRVTNGTLANLPLSSVEQDRATTGGNNIVFPSSLCNTVPVLNQAVTISDHTSWLQDIFPSSDPKNGFCFLMDFLDQNQSVLLSGVQGIALRNPIISTGSQVLTTPLQEILQIPIIIKACEDDINYNLIYDDRFFNYQKFILGTPFEVDLCFYSLDDTQFAYDFRVIAESKLNTAKLNNPLNLDLAFVVLFHHQLSTEFFTKQESMAQTLYELAQLETSYTSPRLVGSFVYDSIGNFLPNFMQQSYIIWCPQQLLSQDTLNIPLAEENCTIFGSVDLDLQVINFVAPLGPLPSLDAYNEYVNTYNDEGLARNPKLIMQSVPIDANTEIDDSNRITYFQGVRYTISSGERARFCSYTDLPFRFRRVSEGKSGTLYDNQTINEAWLSNNAEDEYLIGISWSFPYWAAIDYDTSLTGEIVSVIPFSQGASALQTLGDEIWLTENWDFGSLTQKCTQYCDHPYYDETGAYQLRSRWVSQSTAVCPSSIYPIWNEL